MAKAQGKKVAAAAKAAAKADKKKGTKKPAAPQKPKPAKKPAPAKKKAEPAKKKAAAPTKKKPAAKKAAAPAKKKAPAQKAAVKAKAPAKAPAKATAKVVVKPVAKPAAKTVAKAVPKAAKPVKAAVVKAVKDQLKAATPAAKIKTAPKAVPPSPPAGPVAPAPKPPAAAEEKKRGRRARPRVHSSGAPAAAWLSTEKPRPASFIPAPPRAEAPSAIAAPPASSDRLIRPDDIGHPAVRTVPVRIDIEQGAGRFYVIANPPDITLRASEGIEWDFRYIGGADVTVDEIVIEFERPSPFAQSTFRSRRPGGARPHRQMSGGASPNAAGKHVQYSVRAMNQFKTEVARTTASMNVTA